MFNFTRGSLSKTRPTQAGSDYDRPDEDKLTAAVFGLMSHLPAPEFLYPFLERMVKASKMQPQWWGP